MYLLARRSTARDFDYIQAGVPVLVADLPEMRRTVLSNGVGEILEEKDREASILAKRVEEMISNTEKYQTYLRQCEKTAKVLNWDHEKKSLIKIYAQYTN